MQKLTRPFILLLFLLTSVVSRADDIFSTTYGQKWVTIVSQANSSYYLSYKSYSGTDQLCFTSSTGSYTESEEWCLVGTANNFQMYNRSKGESYIVEAPTSASDNGFIGFAATNSGYLTAGTSGTNYYIGPYGTSRYWNLLGGGDTTESGWNSHIGYWISTTGDNALWTVTVVEDNTPATTITRTVAADTWESFCLPFNIDISTLQNNFDQIYIPYNGEDLIIYGDATSKRRLAPRKAAASVARYTFAYSATGTTTCQFYLTDFTSESGVVIPQGMPIFAHIKATGATDLASDGTLTLTGYLFDGETAQSGQLTTSFPVYSDAKLTTEDTDKTFAVIGELSSDATTPSGTLYALGTDGTFTAYTGTMDQYHAYLNTASAATIDLHPLPLSELSTQKAPDYDINADDLVNIVDVAQLISILNGSPDTYGNADVNHDLTIGMDDLSLLIQKVINPANAEITIDIDPADDTPVATDFSIQNEAVTDYLSHTTATLSSTADTSYGQSFFDTSRTYRPDQPATRTITFDNAGASEVTITMATDASYTNTVLSTTTTASTYTLRNFVPGNTYYYKVTDSNNSTLTSGALNATGQVRMIAIDNGFNIRDLGGWTGLNGNTVRYEALYRGGSLGGTDMNGNTSDITDDDRAELSRIGIRAQLDLRAATNSGKYASEKSLHSYSRGATTLTDADFNNTMTDYGAYNQDASIVSDVAWIIYELKQGHPVYFNCRQGADRTGTVAFIIEGLLGCYGSDTGHQMAMDYELTGFSQANLIDNVSVETSYRAATEAYSNTSKLFYALLNLTADTSTDPDVTLTNLQERCYYYLNRYWNGRAESGSSTSTAPATLLISRDDLDWFINYMLGITDLDGTLTATHVATDKLTAPSWAQNYTTTLQTVAEAKANVVTYK